MGYTNATDKPETEHSDIKVAVNSIQTTALVKRICIDTFYSVNEIYSYDLDNLYPQKAIAIKQRSWALTSTTKTLSDFITGDGFEDEALNEAVVNSEGITGYDLLRYISNQKSELGFSLHFNFNIFGIITEINPIDFEDLRVMKNGKLAWNRDWSQPYDKDMVEYHKFNPDTVLEEIREVGIEDYNGQVLYWTGTNKIYPLATFDAALDSGQYQAESELFKLRNLQNDWMPSGALQYPANLDNDKDFSEAKQKIKSSGTGANNASKIVLIGTTPDNEAAKNLWHPFERSNVDKLYETQNKEAKEIIFSVFRQPAILGTVNPSGGWPNMQEMEDAFVLYNSIVEQDRKEVEKTLTKVFEASIWDFADVKILPKMLIKNEGAGTEPEAEIKEGSDNGPE